MIAGVTGWILSLSGTALLAIVFLVPALEASAFLGFLFPGEIAVLLGGVLASAGRIGSSRDPRGRPRRDRRRHRRLLGGAPLGSPHPRLDRSAT